MRRAPLWPDRVLGDLDQHGVAGLQRVLDPALLALEVDGFPVDFTGVEHGVAAASDVDEGGFHGRQHVLDLAQVDVADQGILLGLRDEVLGQDAVLEDADLDSVVALADDHLAVDGFAPGQELGLGDDGAAAAGIAGFAAALLLRLQPGGALEGRDAVVDRGLGGRTGRADAGHRVGRIVVLPAGQFQVLVATAAATAAARGHAVFELLLGAFFCFFRFVPVAFGRSLSAPDSLSDPRLLRPRRPRLRRRRRLPASSPSPSSPSSSSASATAAAAGAGRTAAVRSGAWKIIEVTAPGSRKSEAAAEGASAGVSVASGAAGAGASAAASTAAAAAAVASGVTAVSSAAGASAAGASAAGASAAGTSATGAAALARLARRRTGFSTGTSAASAAGASAAAASGCRRRGIVSEGRQGFGRLGDLAGAGAADGRLGLGFGRRSRDCLCGLGGNCCGGVLLAAAVSAASAGASFFGRALRRVRTGRFGGVAAAAASAASSATSGVFVGRYNLVIIHMWRHSCP